MDKKLMTALAKDATIVIIFQSMQLFCQVSLLQRSNSIATVLGLPCIIIISYEKGKYKCKQVLGTYLKKLRLVGLKSKKPHKKKNNKC